MMGKGPFPLIAETGNKYFIDVNEGWGDFRMKIHLQGEGTLRVVPVFCFRPLFLQNFVASESEAHVA